MKKFIVFILFLFLLPMKCFSANVSDVVINEVAWMGGAASANDEWMELKNNTLTQIDLTGWTLQSSDGKLKINLKGVILPNGFYLLERTDDNSVPNVTADLIYTGALSNSGMDLKLYDNLSNVIDEVNCLGKWFAGDNTTKQTMEKTISGWQTSQNPGGTPKAENRLGTANGQPQTTSQETEQKIPVETPVIYPSGIFINEIMPNPKGADEQDEWVELYNSNNVDVDVSGWQIKDIEGTTTTYTISKDTNILANGFLIFKRPDTKIMLNNDKDGLVLLTPDNKEADAVNFTTAPLGLSYNKINSGWQWSITPTPGAINIIMAVQKMASSKDLSKSNISGNNKVAAGLADVSYNAPANQEDTKHDNPWFLFFIALAGIIILALAAILIKLKLARLNRPKA